MKHSSRVSITYLLAIAGLGGLLYGVDFGVIAAAEPYMKALGVYSDSQISHVVGAVLLGGLLSSISAGWLCDFFGRKKMIVASSAMFLVAIPIVSLSLDSFPVLFAFPKALFGWSERMLPILPILPMPMLPTANWNWELDLATIPHWQHLRIFSSVATSYRLSWRCLY